jgi:hypothetical protein
MGGALAFCLFGEQFHLPVREEVKVSQGQGGSHVQSGNSEWECGNWYGIFGTLLITLELERERVRDLRDLRTPSWYGIVISLQVSSLARLGGGTRTNQR